MSVGSLGSWVYMAGCFGLLSVGDRFSKAHVTQVFGLGTS